MNVTCPKCNHEFEARVRASIGSGTQKGKFTKLSKNRVVILGVLRKKLMTAQTVLSEIQKLGIKRESSRGTGWNYHTIQADLSILVGGEYVQMHTDGKDVYNPQTGHFEVSKLPVYELTEKGRMIANNVTLTKGRS